MTVHQIVPTTTIEEKDPYYDNVIFYMKGGVNGANNNQFTNVLTTVTNTYTAVGSVPQSSINPFMGLNQYSAYAYTANQFVVGSSSPLLNANAWTVEFWMYPLSYVNAQGIFGASNGGGASPKVAFQINGANISLFKTGSVPAGCTVGQPTIGSWTNVSISKSNTGTVFIHYNGFLQTATFFGTETTVTSPFQWFSNGEGATSGMYGYLSNGRVSNISRYNGSNYVPSTVPLVADTSTVLLSFQENKFTDLSTATSKPMSPFGGMSIQKFSPWAGDQYKISTHGGSAYFDGNGANYVPLPTTGICDFGSAPFTVEGWIYPLSFFNYGTTFITQSSNVAGCFSIGYDSLGNLGAGIYDGTNRPGTSGYIQFRAWSHFAVTRSGSQFYIYINGVRQGSGFVSGMSITSQDPRLGVNPAASNERLHGYLAGLRVVKGSVLYSGARFTVPTQPPVEVNGTSLLMKFDNLGIYDSANQYVVQPIGGAQGNTSINKWSNAGSAYVPTGGTSGKLNSISPVEATTYITLQGAFTIECWVYLLSSGRHSIFGEPSGNAYSTAWGFLINDSLGAYGTTTLGTLGLTFWLSPINGYGGNVVYSGQYPELFKWTHCVWQRDASNNWSFFMDGVKGPTLNGNSTTHPNSQLPANNGPAGSITFPLITGSWGGYEGGGNSSYTAAGINAYITDLRITRGLARYTNSFTKPNRTFSGAKKPVVQSDLGPFAIAQPCKIEYFMVGGGGGGGGSNSGGGGGGGVRSGSIIQLSGFSIGIIIGQGGIGTSGASQGTAATPTILTFEDGSTSVIAYQGGHGRSSVDINGGGSIGVLGRGGGGGGQGSVSANDPNLLGGTGIYSGGSGSSNFNGGGGGGAGAGGAGLNGTPTVGGNGGIGILSTIDNQYYGGGGGGSGPSNSSLGGIGGGGNGAQSGSSGADAQANSGGGGGSGFTGGNGASGICIIKLDSYLPVQTTGNPTVTTSGNYKIYKFTANGSLTIENLGSYDLVADRASFYEGEVASFTLTTTGIATGTNIGYVITGTTSATDFVNSSTEGTAIVNSDGITKIFIPTVLDQLLELEKMYLSVNGRTASCNLLDLAFNVDVLIVAGGGGGAKMGGGGGGGGAGGVLAVAFAADGGITYPISVGGGGAENSQGFPSSFHTISTVGGGYGGGQPLYDPSTPSQNGGSGGSGGGGTGADNATWTNGSGGAGTPGQGNNGGGGVGGGSTWGGGGGGGGGAGGLGANGSGIRDGGSGGVGIQSSISGSSLYYGGGGGGSANARDGTGTPGNGGLGGGGRGGGGISSLTAIPGTPNTGGGGGAGGNNGTNGSGQGGSGVVIIRSVNTLPTATVTGSPTFTNSGGYKVYTFTGSGSIRWG